MRLKYSGTKGNYLPAIFFMRIETAEDFTDLDSLSMDSKSTLYHEYVHFVQDITTLYGLGNIAQLVDLQAHLIGRAKEGQNNTFQVPMEIAEGSDLWKRLMLFDIYEGDKVQQIEGISEILDVRECPVEGILDDGHICSIMVSYKDLYGRAAELEFGAHCINEGMAHLIQDCLSDDVEANYFPYQIAHRVCAHLYPALAVDKRNVVYLCDIALNTSHPAKFFVDMIRALEQSGMQPAGPEGLYDWFEGKMFRAADGARYTFYDLYKKQSELAVKQLQAYFPGELFTALRKWIELVFTSALDMRIREISFWADILGPDSKDERREKFTRLTRNFGYPLMSNRNDAYYFHHPEIQVPNIEVFRAVAETHKLFLHAQKGCQMKGFCSSGPSGDITSSLCDEPWKRIKTKYTCAFTVLWIMWGLAEKTPVFSSETG